MSERLGIIVWLTVITVALFGIKFLLESHDKRITNIESSAEKVERWVCSHTARQRVLVLTEVSGAFPAYMDVCDEWKAK